MKKLKWYILAICAWIFIFPVTGIVGLSFIISGSFAIVAGVTRCVFNLFGIDIVWLHNSVINLGIFTELIISLTVGITLLFVGILLWKITVKIYKWLNKPLGD